MPVFLFLPFFLSLILTFSLPVCSSFLSGVLQYKYQLNIDGTIAAYRLPYLLAGGSLVFKQDSQYYEHFYHDLEPWVHYVPMNENISDVEEKLRWALENDDKV